MRPTRGRWQVAHKVAASDHYGLVGHADLPPPRPVSSPVPPVLTAGKVKLGILGGGSYAYRGSAYNESHFIVWSACSLY